jgi:hypothetical protein
MSSLIQNFVEDEGYNPDYKQLNMVEQLGKVIDSKDLPKPRDWVVTDDGDTIRGIKWFEANAMKDGLMKIQKTADRLYAQDQIQTTVGFTRILNFVRKQIKA